MIKFLVGGKSKSLPSLFPHIEGKRQSRVRRLLLEIRAEKVLVLFSLFYSFIILFFSNFIEGEMGTELKKFSEKN